MGTYRVETEDGVFDVELDDSTKESKTTTKQVEKPSLINEFIKANEQISGGIRSTFQDLNPPKGFNNPSLQPKFQQSYPQVVMDALQKTPIRNLPEVPQTAILHTLSYPAAVAGAVTDMATNPGEVAGAIVSAGVLNSVAPKIANAEIAFQNFLSRKPNMGSALSSSKMVPKLGRAESVFTKRASDIQSRADAASAGELAKLKNEKEALTAQINNTKGITTEAKTTEIQKTESDYAKRLLETQEKINGIKKALPKSAQQDVALIKKEIPEWMGKQSERWNAEIDAQLGGPDADIFVNADTLRAELSSLLRSRGVEIDAAGEIDALTKSLSPAESKIVDVIKRIDSSSQLPSVRSLIKDTNYFGSKVKYGKVFNSEQALLDDAKDIVASQAEDIIPSLKNTKAWYSDYAQIRNRSFKSLDPLGGKYSTKGTQFFEKLASGNAHPEDFQFLTDLESAVGKKAGRTSFDLSAEEKSLEQFKERLKQSSKEEVAKIQESLDKEISRLDEVLKQESVSMENTTGSAIKAIEEKAGPQVKGLKLKANEARIKLAKVNRMKNIAKWVTGLLAGEETLIGVGRKNLLRRT